ncbi:MAG: DNA polymerase III subunit gamma/tau [Spirochaetes bacterium]|nr:DNA polymerase III subunit gamma/tau [Spirochaetota bacterium]
MTYQVIARKWRPQKFEDVVFQDHISKIIRNSIRMGRISHAYLFSGPRGVGKTTMARILAKALNCLSADNPTDNPCDVCENCIEIKQGYSFDVIEIDGASNRGIDNIRDLRENVNLAPVKARYKVYIIDEVHMLTKEAFNALLKTLEEPPKHVVFIFATTEIHRIPETILSRCQKYLFKKIPVKSIANHLEKIIHEEGYKIDKGALYPIARAGEGSMRDSQSLLDQVISFSDGAISEEDALSILGIVTLDSYLKLLTFISNPDPAGLVDEIDRISVLGIDISRYVAGFIDIIRTIRLVNNGIILTEILGFSNDEMQALKKAGSNFTDEELSIIYKLASDLQTSLRFSTNERINLEMALLDMISVKKSPSVASILRKISEARGTGLNSAAGTAGKQTKNTTQVNNEESAIDNIKSLFHGEVID